MSSANAYVPIFDKVVVIAKSYYFANFITGFTPELVNLLLTNHIVLLRSTETYEQVMNMVNTAMSSHLKSNVDVAKFITVEAD